MEDSVLMASRFWIQRVFVPIFVFMGVIGNSITVMILTRRRMRCTTHIYLTALALADIIYLLFSLILSFEHYPNAHLSKYVLYWRFYGIAHWLADAASNTSVWLTVSFTIERYIIVCHPLKGKVYCTERRAKNIITIVTLLCVFSIVSTSFEHQLTSREKWAEHCNGTRETDESRTQRDIAILSECSMNYEMTKSPVELNENKTCCLKQKLIYTESTELGKNETYTSIFYWFVSIAFGWLPVLLVAMFNCFLIRTVFISTNARKAMINSVESSKQRNEYRVTILLIGIIILFLICQTPTALYLIYDSLDEPSDNHTKRVLGNIFNFLQLLNASCNFVMYCLLSKNYRKTFRSVFCARKLNRQDTNALSVSHLSRSRRTAAGFCNRRNKSEYRTPRNLEASSLTSIPRSKSLMVRPLGKARSTDLNV